MHDLMALFIIIVFILNSVGLIMLWVILQHVYAIRFPETDELCPHGDPWDDCPDCRH